MSKTAIQKLIAAYKASNPSALYSPSDVTEFLTHFLAVEKQQIIQAHTEGQVLIYGLIKEKMPKKDWSYTDNEVVKATSGSDNDEKSEDYYTKTYLK